MRDHWQLYALASAFFAGLTAIFGKAGVQNLNSNLATFFRTVVILMFLVALVSIRGEWQKLESIPQRSLLFLVLSGLATGLSWVCYFRALQLGPVSQVAPVDKLSVVFAILLAAVFFREALTWQTILGGGMVACGALILALS